MAKPQVGLAAVTILEAPFYSQKRIGNFGIFDGDVPGYQQVGHIDHTHADTTVQIYAIFSAIADIATGTLKIVLRGRDVHSFNFIVPVFVKNSATNDAYIIWQA